MNRDVKRERDLMKSLGWQYEGIVRNGHLAFSHPEWGRMHLPYSPRSDRWRENARTRLARKMGITRADLNALIRQPARVRKRTLTRLTGGV